MHALKVLEFHQIQKMLSEECQTEIGIANAWKLRPFFSENEVWDLVSYTEESLRLQELSSLPSLNKVFDARLLLDRASKGGLLTGEQICSIAAALEAMRALKTYLFRRQSDSPKIFALSQKLPDLMQLEKSLLDAFYPGGDIKDTASQTLYALRRQRRGCSKKITEKISSYLTGKYAQYLSEPFYTLREGRFVIPLKSENRGKIKGVVHDSSGSGQTLYLEPEDVLQEGNELRKIEGEEREEIIRLLRDFSKQIGAKSSSISLGIEITGEIDLYFAKAYLGKKMKGTLPLKGKQHSIQIHHGRHPLLDPLVAVPVSLELGHEFDALLLTGPNTGGKTVSMKTVGLFAAMAQSGLMLPADEVSIGPFSQIWADIGDEQSLQHSLSTFSGHMKNISEALRSIKPGALILLDEVGAGTDPSEGAALAKAILSALKAEGAKILASTHYGELKLFAYETVGFRNAAMEFNLKTLSPTYHLHLDGAGASYGLKIAHRCGLSESIIEVAKEHLGSEKQDLARILESLSEAQRQARHAQGRADRLAGELTVAQQRAADALAKAKEVKSKAKSQASEEVHQMIRTLKEEANTIFQALKNNPSQKQVEIARAEFKELSKKAREKSLIFSDEVEENREVSPFLRPGMNVRHVDYSQAGTILEILPGEMAMVQLGAMKLRCSLVKLVSLQGGQALLKTVKRRYKIELQQRMEVANVLHIRRMRVQEAEEKLEKFLDDAVLEGFRTVKIIHGKGDGILRNLTQKILRAHAGVKSFETGKEFDGGYGTTIAILV